jgi:hypothetical protein
MSPNIVHAGIVSSNRTLTLDPVTSKFSIKPRSSIEMGDPNANEHGSNTLES